MDVTGTNKPSADKSHVEAWKSLIELGKTTISIASAVLTALVGFYVLNQSKFNESNINYIPPFLLIASIVMAIYGFGRAIRAIKTGNSEISGVVLINISVFLLVAGIISIALFKFDKKKSLNEVLTHIEKESKTFKIKLNPKLMKKVEVIDSNYLINYQYDANTIKVIYSEKENRIIKVE